MPNNVPDFVHGISKIFRVFLKLFWKFSETKPFESSVQIKCTKHCLKQTVAMTLLHLTLHLFVCLSNVFRIINSSCHQKICLMTLCFGINFHNFRYLRFPMMIELSPKANYNSVNYHSVNCSVVGSIIPVYLFFSCLIYPQKPVLSQCIFD